MEIARKRTLIL